MQPHVRKCFEGIDHLDFRPDKFGNQDIVGMVSAQVLLSMLSLQSFTPAVQDEVVPFSTTIYPVDAKGMVEKWLLQVEKQMVKSLRDTIEKAMSSYYSTELSSWVVDWPGQAVVCCRLITVFHNNLLNIVKGQLTGQQRRPRQSGEFLSSLQFSPKILIFDILQSEQKILVLTPPCSKGSLAEFLDKCNSQLESIVQLVRNGLSPRARNTLGSLITVDVHSR